ncbi:hypothetical protein AYO21_11058 [Fonsecaea monophora]|uniref:Elongator complex protein 5 n=1 Tax=Fonsecaea monophora TaxID=254056 RepID=A0A177ERZ7_9EURO|nr:hypothetical protein AYO21_11058 [Fonsecaea monophora]KAH0846195.1 killer toxin sensitivity protein [Fonsecaea pedrosoi]OAG34757.1 hypothetical protein AYO21_11058 [Fonsecaea monophora]
MSHTHTHHRRTHNLLLISKLLSQHPHHAQTSPFTLVLDSLEQPARPLTREYLRRARLSRRAGMPHGGGVVVVVLGFETFAKPVGADYFVPCHGYCHDVGQSPSPGRASGAGAGAGVGVGEKIAREVGEILRRSGGNRFLIMIDSLLTLAALSIQPTSNLNLTAFLSSLLQPPALQTKGAEQGEGPQVSLVAVYHTDVPLPSPPPSTLSSSASLSNSYSPSPLSLLSYLATTVITIHSLPILLAEKSARSKSLAAPAFGLSEEIEGVVIGLKSKSVTKLKQEERGVVLELEHRRRSGRGVREWFFLPTSQNMTKKGDGQPFREIVILLDDHPLFRSSGEEETVEELSGMTFELGLTERQRLEREGVVLPYFDAQKAGGGAGEGGRILYDMGVEDDFDEEEDEI